MWDERYGKPEYAYGKAPNDFVAEMADRLPPGGRVLCIAEGEGRNAVFLAGRGHPVVALDQSAVGLRKAEQLAAEAGVEIETRQADLADADLGGGWDGIVSTWAHMPPALRRDVHRRCVEALAPGGVLILEAYTPRQLARGTGGPPVVLIPGWQTPEASMAPLGAYLRWLGHDARGWGLGVNEGAVREARDALLPRLQAAAEASGTRPALVGWSLGGVIAREVARERPDLVAQVITYGSPVVGGPTYTIGARAYGEATCRALAAEAEALDRTKPIEVPLTIVFSRADRVVAWPACIDRTSRRARHVEVASTHVGMGVDPDVWEVVAQQLVCAR